MTFFLMRLRAALALGGLAVLTACAAPAPKDEGPAPLPPVPGYEVMEDGDYVLPAVDPVYLQDVNRRMEVYYPDPEKPGTVIVDPYAKFLYLIEENGIAIRYPVAVGRAGKAFKGNAVIGRVEKWPGWTPTAHMLKTEPEVYGEYAGGLPGGLASPLGARGLYLYRNGKDTYYRIHGTNDQQSIGNAGSAGCIRMFNQDIVDLFDRVHVGTKVYVRSYEDSVRLEGEELANRGVELPARTIPRAELMAQLAAAEAALAAYKAAKAAKAAEEAAAGDGTAAPPAN